MPRAKKSKVRWPMDDKYPLPPEPEFRYGDDRTIHGTEYVDVETFGGKVVAVWFRCMPVPFKQAKADTRRASDMEEMYRGKIMPVKAVVFKGQPGVSSPDTQNI